jgi:RimJ/RimL family protein N-acetyltransferase
MVLERSETGKSGEPEVKNLDLKSPILETARLLLRPLHLDDAPDIARLANDYAVASMLASMPHPYFAEDASEFIERTKAQGDCVYAITLKQKGEFLGVCGIHEDAARFELPFVGYWLGQPFWGHGYATEATRAMVDLFFKVTDRDVLMVSARIGNAASRRVIEKCNARFWKRGTHYNRALGEMHELDHFRISRDDWFAVAAKGR